MSKGKEYRSGITLFAVLCVSLIVVALQGCGADAASRVTRQLDLGNRYLAELNYEEAIVAFQK